MVNANPLQVIRKFADSIFPKNKEGSVLGIDIGFSSIKIVQLRRRHGSAVLETYGELALGPYAGVDIGRATNLSAEKLAEALNDLLKEANATTRNSGISIPFAASLISFIQMPALDRKQLARMIPIEARKYIPVPIGEVALDWFIIPEGEGKFFTSDVPEEAKEKPGKKVSVLLVAIHKETLNKYREIIKAANLSSSFFEIEIFSTMRAVLSQSIAPTMILDMGAASTKLYIIEHGIVKISHTVNKGSQDITLTLSKSLGVSATKAEELKREFSIGGDSGDRNISEAVLLTLEYIFSEANRVLLNYQQKYNKNISQIILTGGGVTLDGFVSLASKNLDTEVVLGDPFAKVETPAFLEDVLKQAGPEFAVAVGLALRKLQELS